MWLFRTILNVDIKRVIKRVNEGQVLRQMLSDGMFGSDDWRILPVLSGASFYDFYVGRGKPFFDTGFRDYVHYKWSKENGSLRNLGIPNPFAYANLSNLIADHLPFLRSFYEGLHPIPGLRDEKHYLVKTDIKNCFHSVTAASVVKALSELNEKAGESGGDGWCRQLETLIDNQQNNETGGLVPGPYSTFLLSEILLLKVDSQLYAKGHMFERVVDDFCHYASSPDEAERFLSDLSDELKVYHLELNTAKTRVSPLPNPSLSLWLEPLRRAGWGNGKWEGTCQVLSLEQLKPYLDLAENLTLEQDNLEILRHALDRISANFPDQAALRYYASRLDVLTRQYPTLIPYAEKDAFSRFEFEPDVMMRIARNLYRWGIDNANYYICLYPVYWSMKLRLPWEIDTLAEDAIASKDCLFLLLTWLRMRMDRNKDGLFRLEKFARALPVDAFDRYWPFVYELLPAEALCGDFRMIKRAKVSFLSEDFR